MSAETDTQTDVAALSAGIGRASFANVHVSQSLTRK